MPLSPGDMPMRSRRLLVPSGAVLLLGLYVASPMVALWRLGCDLQRGDVAALRAAVDWPKVRAGLRADIDSALTGAPAVRAVSADDGLPAFGSGMMTHIADGAVDQAITPHGLLAMVAGQARAPGRGGPGLRLDWACPTGLTSFEAALGEPGSAPIRVRLDFARGAWRVTRIWIPSQMIPGGTTRT